MKILIFFNILFSLFLYQTSFAGNDTLLVTLYETSEDFLHKKPMITDAMLITKAKAKGKGHFFVKKIIDRTTGKKVNDINFIWAITHHNDTYLNMAYLESGNAPGTFVIADVVGKYCVIKYDDRVPFPHYYDYKVMSAGFGLAGLIVNDINETIDRPWKWKDSKENIFPVLFCDTEEKESRNFANSQNESCRIKYFKRKNYIQLRYKNPDIPLHADSTVEEIMEYFRSENILFYKSLTK